MPIAAPAQDKLAAFGADAILELVAEGTTLCKIAGKAEVSLGRLIDWIGRDPILSARVRDTRMALTAHWDEEVVRLLDEAPATPEEMTRVREQAQHLRWRMSRLNRAVYGDKIDVNHSGTVTLEALVSQSIVKTIEHEPD